MTDSSSIPRFARAALLAALCFLVACPSDEPDPDEPTPDEPTPTPPVDADQDGSFAEDDCDDEDPARFPGNPEVCDGVDNDCDGVIPDDEADGDEDGVAECAGDCDDGDPDRGPDRQEACDGVDNDCDGEVPAEEADGDEDGFAPCEGDCDDATAERAPGLNETCDGTDEDCDPATDETVDIDGDGVAACDGDCSELSASVFPGAEEVCNGVDDDCDAATEYQELVGIQESISVTFASRRLYGTVWQIDRETVVRGFEQYAKFAGTPTVVFQVYSAPSPDGPWTRLVSESATAPPQLDDVEGWHASPSMELTLQAGTSYLFGIWIDGGGRWFGNWTAPELLSVPFGRPVLGRRSGATSNIPDAGDIEDFALGAYTNRLLVDHETDVDGDGALPCLADCWDADPAVHEGAPELACDWIDQDCDPTTPDCPPFVITEVMPSPMWDDDDSWGEWIEVTNVGSAPLDLQGLSLHTGNDSYLFEESLVLAAGAALVLTDDEEGAVESGLPYDATWDDRLELDEPAEGGILGFFGPRGDLVDVIDFGDGSGWPSPIGTSLSLDPASTDSLLNDSPSAWCWSFAGAYAGTFDRGSPGVANPACPAIVSGAVAGDLVLSEIQWDPAEGTRWFEVYNPTSAPIDLTGWTFAAPLAGYGGGEWVITESIVVPSLGHAWFSDYPPGAGSGLPTPADFFWWNVVIEESAATLEVVSPEGTLIDSVAWDTGLGWPDQAGAAMSLDPGSLDATANDAPGNWCSATSALPPGEDLGTPGAANDPCD